MKTQAKAVVDSLKPLLEVCLKYAQRFDADEIRIAVGRAKELHKLVKELEDEIPKKENNSMFEYLDQKIAVWESSRTFRSSSHFFGV